MYVCVCECVIYVYMRVSAFIHKPAEDKENLGGLPDLSTFHLLLLRGGLSLNLELCWHPGSHSNPRVFCSHRSGVTGVHMTTPDFFCWFGALEFKS